MRTLIHLYRNDIGEIRAYQEYQEFFEGGIRTHIPVLKYWEGDVIGRRNINMTEERNISEFFPAYSGKIFLTGGSFIGSGCLKKLGEKVL